MWGPILACASDVAAPSLGDLTGCPQAAAASVSKEGTSVEAGAVIQSGRAWFGSGVAEVACLPVVAGRRVMR